MNRRPPEFTRTDPPVPYTTLFRSQPAGDRESKDDQRDRDRVDEKIAEPLRRDDVDIAKTQYEQERLAKAEPDEGEQKGDEGDVTHRCALPRRRVRRRGAAATACAGSLRGRDRRDRAGAKARTPSRRASDQWKNCRP